jgi:AmmeMemoRadiSam system protein A
MLPAERLRLLEIAREAVRVAARSGRRYLPPPEFTPALLELRAAFVTLHKGGDLHRELRGCIGSTVSQYPLYRAVAESGYSAAKEDPRFSPVEAAEVSDISIEISVLSPFTEIRPADIVPGTHGLMVSLGASRGLLLPQVAVEHHLTAERFLEETCRKAGLPRDAWRNARPNRAKIEAFTAEVFSE